MQSHNTKRAPARDSEFKVFNKVAQLHRLRPNQQLTLPTSVKRILRCPADELVWDRFEMLRNVVVAELEGERDYALDSRDAIEKLARGPATARGVECSETLRGRTYQSQDASSRYS